MTIDVPRSIPVAMRARLLAAACAWLACLVFADSAWAGRIVRVYEVDVRGTPSPSLLQDAMRQTLVRATGRREAADDPALAALVADPSSYVRSYRTSEDGVTRVVFDGAAIERDIVAAGRGVWGSERPFTLIVLSPPPGGAAGDAARVTLEETALVRGLPVSLVPIALTDSTGNELDRETLLRTAQRLGGDAVLVGRGNGAALHGQWQWTLHTSFSSESWTGSLEDGVHGAADAFARVLDTSLAPVEMETLIEVRGVTTLTDYATVGRLLDSLPGVSRASLVEADGTSVTFGVHVRGGAEAIDQALDGSARLVRAGAANARLVYEYRP